ncbi:MAG: alpha/beta fold hydrolase [Sphingobium sp.]|nr:alpha/beta fold hydrolase [Sphingobium sp.]
MSGDRTNYVLVHGAFHGGWCWRRVVDRIAERGGRALAPTLTGLGDRSHLINPDIDLSTHIADIVNLVLWEDLHDIILCGHSYAGMVISGVAERIPDRIAALIYLDALKPAPGACLWDYLTPAGRDEFERSTFDGLIHPKSAAAFLVNAADRQWVDSKCTPQPRATFHERLPKTEHRSRIPRTYVCASAYGSAMLTRFAEEAAADPAWRRIDLPYGHDLMIDAPDEVADLLLEAA